MIFDGRAFAKEIEEEVKRGVEKLAKIPVVTSILVGNDPASELYTSLKQKAAERCGIDYRVIRIDKSARVEEVIKKDISNGLMIQLPIPGMSREEQNELIELIPSEKDVDGLKWEESQIMPATVKAILLILEKISQSEKDLWQKKFLVVGGTGAVGRPLVHYLKTLHKVDTSIANSKTTDLQGETLKAGVIISCVGRAGLITYDMIDSSKIVIDVGISANQRISESANQPRVVGDMEKEVYGIAKVAVPVPGGVGPVTVASLMKNAYEMYTN